MNDPSPYQPPSAVAPPPLAMPSAEPASIKVFGILHLVLGGLGILTGLWGVVSSVFSSSFVGIGVPAGEETEVLLEAQRAYMEEITWVGVLGSVFTLVLAGLLIVAGLGLVRKRPAGLRWSNRYAWTSIATKLVNMVLAVLVTVPAVNRMLDAMMADSGAGADSIGTVMRVTTTVGSLAGPLVMMSYPIVTLVLLNRRPVREFFEARAASPAGGVAGSAPPR